MARFLRTEGDTKRHVGAYVGLHMAPGGGAGLNDGLFSETMDFREFPSVLSAVHIAQS